VAYPYLSLKFLTVRRHNVHPASQQNVFKTEVEKACIFSKKASVHTYSKTQLRDTFIGKWLWHQNNP